MTLSDTARAHVAQCHREDVSEELLLKLSVENDALRAELVDLRDEADRLRDDRNGIIANVPSAAREG